LCSRPPRTASRRSGGRHCSACRRSGSKRSASAPANRPPCTTSSATAPCGSLPPAPIARFTRPT
jgi:hypothetical protein